MPQLPTWNSQTRTGGLVNTMATLVYSLPTTSSSTSRLGTCFFFIAAVERNDRVRLTKLDSRYDLTQSARVQIQTDDSLLYIHLNWILFNKT